jgi:hypothetical protein
MFSFSSSILIHLFILFLIFSEGDDSDFELDDDDIDKILIITPTPPSNRKQQQKNNYERTGEYTPRARMTAEIAKIIDDGLRWYEEELWHDRPVTTTIYTTLIYIYIYIFLFF